MGFLMDVALLMPRRGILRLEAIFDFSAVLVHGWQ
jgi:hypothetical protein